MADNQNLGSEIPTGWISSHYSEIPLFSSICSNFCVPPSGLIHLPLLVSLPDRWATSIHFPLLLRWYQKQLSSEQPLAAPFHRPFLCSPHLHPPINLTHAVVLFSFLVQAKAHWPETAVFSLCSPCLICWISPEFSAFIHISEICRVLPSNPCNLLSRFLCLSIKLPRVLLNLRVRPNGFIFPN